MLPWVLCAVLTGSILVYCQLPLTTRTGCVVLLVLSDAASTEDLPTLTVPVLVRVFGHTETDQTLEVIRRLLCPLTVETTSLCRVGGHDSVTINCW